MRRSWLVVVVMVGLVGCRDADVHADVRFGAAPDFGEVPLGARRSVLLPLENVGTGPATLTLSASGEFSVEPGSLSLPARSKTSVGIGFDAVTLGERTGELTVLVDGVPTVLPLRALVTGPAVSVARRLRFATAYWVVGGTPEISRATLDVRNVGTTGSTLTFGAPRVEGSGDLCVGRFVAGTCEAWTPGAPLDTVETLALPLELQPTRAGPQTWTVVLPVTDPREPEVRVEVSADAETISPCFFDSLSRVLVGSQPVELQFVHRGPESCLLRSVSLSSGSPFTLQVTPSAPVKLALAESFTARLALQPGAPLDARGMLVIESVGAERVEIALERNIAECLEITPSTLDFGTVARNCRSASATIELRNRCDLAIPVEVPVMGTAAGEPPGGPNCPGPAPCPEFLINNAYPPGTQLAADGGTAQVSVRYSPINFGGDTGALVIGLGDADFVVALLGRGDATAQQEDTFRMDVLPKIDLLTMVDVSPSFVTRRQSVRDNLSALLTRLDDGCRDLRWAVAPADGDPDAGVRLMPNDAGQAWSSSDDPDFVTRALSAFDALPVGSELEACVGPAATLIADAGLRVGAHLAGMCVTDALEQSPDPQASLATFRAAAASSTWSAVVADQSVSCGAEASDDGLHRMLASSGAFETICAPEWYRALAPFSVCTPRERFYLSFVPVSGLEVRVDGAVQDPARWLYDSADNSVRFQPGFKPLPGQTISVRGVTSCTP